MAIKPTTPTLQTRFSEKVKPRVDTGPGKTEQAHKNQTDMNYILKDYHATGMIKHAAKYQGRYDDVPPGDFQDAMNLVTNAQRMFGELPANLRKRFAGDPVQFLEFVQNPDNRDEMRTLGILRGNDGLDITGAATGSPTRTTIEETHDADRAASEAQNNPSSA